MFGRGIRLQTAKYPKYAKKPPSAYFGYFAVPKKTLGEDLGNGSVTAGKESRAGAPLPAAARTECAPYQPSLTDRIWDGYS